MLIVTWGSAGFSFSQELIGLSLLVLLFLYKSASNMRSPTTVTTFDKSRSYFTVERKWLWKQQAIEHSLANIRDVLVIQKGRFGKARIYFRIEIELFSGERIALSSVNYRPEQTVRQKADAIRQFLNLSGHSSQVRTRENR
ncbi:MAG: hypothetical protein GY803_15040 [Chloroflexi bacterium]|nr:hypothetical protein [Chloroflexota bacterium]